MTHEKQPSIFIDWITISQIHASKSLPIIAGGAIVFYDGFGIPRFEKARSAMLAGSFDTRLRIKCDGSHVSLSGNVGRFSRNNNLFNYGWRETLHKANRIILDKQLPSFSGYGLDADFKETRGARISRLDVTANYSTGSESQARALIRWLSEKSVSRMKKGRAGDESVWWSNTRHMLKAYIKHIEMEKHGMSRDNPIYQYCKENGVVRVEVELKKRLLLDEGINKLETITQEKLETIFDQETEIFKRVDRSDEPDIIDALPSKSRIYAAAWLAGEDVRNLASRATLFRHAKVLRDYGIDILEPRSILKFPTKVNIIELKPLSPPDWYEFEDRFHGVEPLKLVVNK